MSSGFIVVSQLHYCGCWCRCWLSQTYSIERSTLFSLLLETIAKYQAEDFNATIEIWRLAQISFGDISLFFCIIFFVAAVWCDKCDSRAPALFGTGWHRALLFAAGAFVIVWRSLTIQPVPGWRCLAGSDRRETFKSLCLRADKVGQCSVSPIWSGKCCN